MTSMASYHPKKKFLSQQDVPSSISCSLNTSDQSGIASSVHSTPSTGALVNSSRVSSILSLDSLRNLSDSDLKFLGSPLHLGSFCNSGLSLDTIEKICSEQEAYNVENGENSAAESNYQRSILLAAPSSSSLVGRDFILDDLTLLASASSLHKSYSVIEECRLGVTCLDSTEINRDAPMPSLPSLPSLSSLSSLSEIELAAHPSTGSLSSILNGLDAGEQVVGPNGSATKSLLTGPDEAVRSTALSDLLTAYEANQAKTSSTPVPPNDFPIPAHQLKLSSDVHTTKPRRSPVLEDSPVSSHTAKDPVVCVKEELDDAGHEVRPVHVTTSGRNRGSGKSQEPKYDCQVCGDVAAGFHCGAYVCEACKKFYLRCFKTQDAPAFLCPKNNDCDVTKDTRSHCQFCRFQKCIRLGMYRPGHEDDKKLKIDFKVIPCKVCNAPSSGFHFGAITCEGCKGFFRRMLKEQLHKKFVCVNSGPCNIDSANRTTCKSCRFEKCLKVGMTLDGTRLGRQSNSVKRRTLMQYVTVDRSNLETGLQQCRGGANDATANDLRIANSGSTSGILETDEDSSEPLCINFPKDQSSYRRRSSNSLDNPVLENAVLNSEIQNLRSREFITESEASFLRYGNRLSSRPQTHFIEENQSRLYVPLDKRKLLGDEERRNNRENSTSFRLSEDVTAALFCSQSKGMPTLASEDQLYSDKNLDGHPSSLPKRFWRNSDLNSSMTDREQMAKFSDRNPVSLRSRTNAGSCFDEGSYVSPTGVTRVSESSEHQNCDRGASASRPSTVNDGLKIYFSPPGNTTSPETTLRPVSAEGVFGVFKTPEMLFGHLVSAFRDLEDIKLRPPDLDDLHYQPVSMQTIWKLVEIPFIHQSKIILKFIKKVPGFRLLAVEDQIKIAQDSLYPVVLLYHSKSYDLETEEFSWFISSPKERDLVLGVLTPFRSMANHFRSIGHIIKRLNTSEEELAFVAAMSVLTASEGSPMKSGSKVVELQDAVVEAFISYQQRGSGRSSTQKRIGELLARLPELKRANIEHRLIIAQVEQMIPEIEMSNLYREIFLSG